MRTGSGGALTVLLILGNK